MEARTPCISTMHDLYLKSKPGTRSLSELVDVFYEMFSRKPHAGAIMECEFTWVGKAIEDFKENGIAPPPDKLPQIDATICWMLTLWTAVDQVAEHLVSSGVLPRNSFDLANWEWADIGFFTSHRRRLKAIREHSLAKYLFNHSMLLEWDWEMLPSKDIADLSFYGRPVEWLADGLVFGKVPRAKLEEALSAVPGIGFIKDHGKTDYGSDWYTYEKWTSWHHRLKVFVRRRFSKKSLVMEDNRAKKNEIQKVEEGGVGTEVACVVEAGSKDLT
jgi:hypothetical protein